MTTPAPLSNIELFFRAQSALALSQRQIGALVGVSRRTVVRWARSGTPYLIPSSWVALATAAHLRDPELAEALAARGGTSLAALGLVAADAAQGSTGAGTGTPSLAATGRDVGDLLVLAAAEAGAATPQVMRPALQAAFARAAALGLSLEQARAALSPAPPAQ